MPKIIKLAFASNEIHTQESISKQQGAAGDPGKQKGADKDLFEKANPDRMTKFADTFKSFNMAFAQVDVRPILSPVDFPSFHHLMLLTGGPARPIRNQD